MKLKDIIIGEKLIMSEIIDHVLCSFVLSIKNESGVLKHYFSNIGGATLTKIHSPSTIFSPMVATPYIDAMNGFNNTGFGLRSTYKYIGLLDVAVGQDANEVNYIASVINDGTGVGIHCAFALPPSGVDINGVTRIRPNLWFRDRYGTTVDILTVLPVNKYVTIQCQAYLK